MRLFGFVAGSVQRRHIRHRDLCLSDWGGGQCPANLPQQEILHAGLLSRLFGPVSHFNRLQC